MLYEDYFNINSGYPYQDCNEKQISIFKEKGKIWGYNANYFGKRNDILKCQKVGNMKNFLEEYNVCGQFDPIFNTNNLIGLPNMQKAMMGFTPPKLKNVLLEKILD